MEPGDGGLSGDAEGVFGEAPGHEFLVLSMWQSSAERGKYRAGSIERLTQRAQTEDDVAAVAGDVVQLEPSWTV